MNTGVSSTQNNKKDYILLFILTRVERGRIKTS